MKLKGKGATEKRSVQGTIKVYIMTGELSVSHRLLPQTKVNATHGLVSGEIFRVQHLRQSFFDNYVLFLRKQ